MVGCGGSVVEYDLAIDCNTGGSVATPGVGTFTYATGTVINLLAEPKTGYHFVDWTGDVSTIADIDDATTTITMDDHYSITASFAFGPQYIPMVAAGGYHTVGLKAGGMAVAAGYNSAGQCNVGNWTDIIQVAVGYGHTVGLEADGSVVAVGINDSEQCNVGNWTDIIQVAAGGLYTVGLKFDSTVSAVGDNTYGQCNVGNWTDIVQLPTLHCP